MFPSHSCCLCFLKQVHRRSARHTLLWVNSSLLFRAHIHTYIHTFFWYLHLLPPIVRRGPRSRLGIWIKRGGVAAVFHPSLGSTCNVEPVPNTHSLDDTYIHTYIHICMCVLSALIRTQSARAFVGYELLLLLLLLLLSSIIIIIVIWRVYVIDSHRLVGWLAGLNELKMRVMNRLTLVVCVCVCARALSLPVRFKQV